MSLPAISIEGLTKCYAISGPQPAYGTLRDSVADATRLAFSRLAGRDKGGAAGQTVWALRDVSLAIQQGEVVGIIGRNGAGKSTLLKILSRITAPTSGRAVLRGRIGSLLEVGTGFHPELTGRENVYLSGAILGMTRSGIQRQLDEIIAFAEVERFIDTPVKRYSSGMYLRLAFAVAAHLEPEILLVDEVLAVGDAAFQSKCLGSMASAARSGRTVLFVSHNLGAIRSLCRRALLLENGQLAQDGEPSLVVSEYLSRAADPDGRGIVTVDPAAHPSGTGEIRILAIRMVGPSGIDQSIFEADRPIRIEICYELKVPLRGARLNLHLLTDEGELAFVSTDHDCRGTDEMPGTYRSACVIPGGLLNRRRYIVGVDSDIPSTRRELLPRSLYASFNVAGEGNHGSTTTEGWPGVVCPRLTWQVERVSDTSFPADRSGDAKHGCRDERVC
jgi:lipopolysaccharide transport system ATP-binding protein